jgi:hypothetical protein
VNTSVTDILESHSSGVDHGYRGTGAGLGAQQRPAARSFDFELLRATTGS